MRPAEGVLCQCEHVEHEARHETSHAYMTPIIGKAYRAEYVGAICADCAARHLAAYLMPARTPARRA